MATLLASALTNTCAQVVVGDAWVRATVSQQKATGAFMQLTAACDTRLVAVHADIGAAELHGMSLDNNIMRMRGLAGLALPAGVAVALKPGANHIMLVNLKHALSVGQHVPITLVFESAGKRRSSIVVDAVVRPLTTPQSNSNNPK